MPYIAAATAAYSVYSGMTGKKKAKKAGKAAARLIMKETQENVRRMRQQNAQTRGLTQATVGASGIQMSGSTAAYARGMDTEMERQLAWTQEAGRLQAKAAKKGAAAAGKQAMSQGIMGAAQAGLSWWGGTGTTK